MAIISLAFVCIVGLILLQEDRIVDTFGGGYLGRYYWYTFSTFMSQFFVVFVSFRTLYKLSLGLLYLLVILTAYFFAIILTPLRITKIIPRK